MTFHRFILLSGLVSTIFTMSPILHCSSSSCAMNFFLDLTTFWYLGWRKSRSTATTTDFCILSETICSVPRVFRVENMSAVVPGNPAPPRDACSPDETHRADHEAHRCEACAQPFRRRPEGRSAMHHHRAK